MNGCIQKRKRTNRIIHKKECMLFRSNLSALSLLHQAQRLSMCFNRRENVPICRYCYFFLPSKDFFLSNMWNNHNEHKKKLRIAFVVDFKFNALMKCVNSHNFVTNTSFSVGGAKDLNQSEL